MVIGLGIGSLHQASSPVDYECASCGKRFSKRTILAKAVVWLAVAGVITMVGVRYAPMFYHLK
jgi:hypothetical protein